MAHSLLIDRWFARLPWSRNWSIALISMFLTAAPAGLAWLDGYSARALFVDNRAQFVYTLIIVYLLLMMPSVLRTREEVASGLRPTVELDDFAYEELVASASAISPIAEISAFCVGLTVGWAINILFEPLGETPSLFDRYAYVSRLLIFGAIGWALAILFAMPRVTNALLRRATRVDVFDVGPFGPIGRQSLWLAITLIGGTILGLFSSSLHNRFLWREYVIVYSVMLVSLLALFIIDTYPAHRVLVAAKRQQLDFVGRRMAHAYYTLQQQLADHSDIHGTVSEMQGLAAVKQQLVAARTWPFDTEMVRSFSLAVFAPLFVGMARLFIDRLIQ